MFDSDTVELIRNAPELSGLDLESLPQEITAAYAAIVSARLRLRASIDTSDDEALSSELEASISQLRRLAFTQEALVAVVPDRSDREAAAFVAGTAHHVVLQAERLRNFEAKPSRLTTDSIAAEVSATLLFLAADSIADAAEMSKHIVVSEHASPTERALLRAIQMLASGRLRGILSTANLSLSTQGSESPAEKATEALYAMLLGCLQALAQQLTGAAEDEDGWLIAERNPLAELREVAHLCSRTSDFTNLHNAPVLSIFPGPSHLASLLIAVASNLPNSATTAVRPPPTLDPGRWASLMREMAIKRPYLWRNHRKAIAHGYLEIGKSAVLSFPTGAGKSTLAELKIAASLLTGKKVVFLAPTLALVDQTTEALASAFSRATVRGEQVQDGLADFDEITLPEIAVMTPERCLTMLSFNPGAFAEAGLLIFDECHLMHPNGGTGSHRSIDSMLCLLNFNSLVPASDIVLISAMISNGAELSRWIEELTTRECLSLDLTWKPTRQVRGCVLYRSDEINALIEDLKNSRRKTGKKNPSVIVKRRMKIKPHGLFCLHQTWHSKQRDAYSLLPLLDQPVDLAIGVGKTRWYLTSNANQVAASLAVGAAASHAVSLGLKTLIFAQTRVLAQSTAQRVGELLGDSAIVLNENERRLYAAASNELGAPEHLYLDADASGRLKHSAASHHGLLLASERHLHEMLFRRADGINVLVATSTLAQGMNLPSQVVIIAGDSRFDSLANQMEKLQAHELLNAAGRAGRAGDSSYGFVLIVPSKVVDFDDDKGKIHTHWMDLQSIFSQSDQCLLMEDPIQPLLDRIHEMGTETGEAERYLLRRLPVGGEADIDAPARALLSRSIGAFRKRVAGEQSWVEERIASALLLRKSEGGASEGHHWTDQVAAAAGIDVKIVRQLSERQLTNAPPVAEGTIPLAQWVLDWLGENPSLIETLFRPESLEQLLGSKFKSLDDEQKRNDYAIPKIGELLTLWMEGKPLCHLEAKLTGQSSNLGKCLKARVFALRIVPELAYICSLPALIDRAHRKEAMDWIEPPASITTLASCVRLGLSSADMMVLHQIRAGKLMRRGVHAQFHEVDRHLLARPQDVPVAVVTARVRRAVRIFDSEGDSGI